MTGRTLAGLFVLVRIGAGYALYSLLGRFLPGRVTGLWRERLDRQGARILSRHFRRHGALLIKIGQFMASRPDIFPLAYVDACAPLRDQAPARSVAVIEAVLARAYEGRPQDHIARLEPTAIAAASFGQVHRAWLRDGQEVAVKVQYPELAANVAADLVVVRAAVRFFRILLPGWPLDQIHAEIVRTSREEQDYLHEGGAADRLRAGLAERGLSVPQVLWAHTREKVLVMEFAHGTTLAALDLDRLEAGERRRIAEVIIDAFLHMLLDAGFFHADPHAGNLLYEPIPDGPARIWLIDFGMTASLTLEDSAHYRRFLDCLRRHDTDGMVDVLIDLGWTLPAVDRSQLRRLAREIYDGLAHLDPQTFKGSQRQLELATKMGEFMRRVRGLVFPLHTVMLSRATGLIEGACMSLVPGTTLLDMVRPRLQEYVGWRRQLAFVWQDLTSTWRTYRQLPDRVEALIAKDARTPIAPLLAGLVLIAGLQLPTGPTRTLAVACAGVAVLATLHQARRGS